MPDALIAGAGPVGLTMAAELARFGLNVRIIDKAAERTDTSKALVLWSRTLELLDRSGCGGTFVAAGNKVHAAAIMDGQRQIAHISFDHIETPYPYALMLPQSETERLLEQHLNSLGVEVERRTELLDFVQGADSVVATIRGADRVEERLQVPWLLGCDGAHSVVRHTLVMPFEGDTLQSDWVLADIHLQGLQSPSDQLTMFWHADGILAFFPITAGRYRVIADLGETRRERSEPTLADIQTLLDDRGPGGIAASDPVWLSLFRINERKVAEYRDGHVFLAGDAAHIHSPAGGQGMNTGMQDACNLAWKLAMVQRGTAAAALLGSYSTERSEIGRQVLSAAGRLTRVALLKGGVPQAIRNHLAGVLFGLSPVRQAMANQFAELSIGYPHSPLTRRSHAHPTPGARAPVRVTDAPVGAELRFALFAAAEDAGSLAGAFPDLLEARLRPPFNEREMTLVRPDGYVSLVTRNCDDIIAYLNHLRRP